MFVRAGPPKRWLPEQHSGRFQTHLRGTLMGLILTECGSDIHQATRKL